MVQYGDAHRLFLQVFISKNILTQKDAQAVYLKVGQRMQFDTPADGLNTFVRNVNEKLSDLSMEIRMGRAESTGEKYYALVNTLEDESSKMATDFTPHEIEFIKKVMETIVASPEGFSDSVELTNLGHDLQKKMTGTQCEALLAKMLTHKWLDYSRGGDYSFGPRALIELGQYMEGKFGDNVKVCELCHTVVVMGDMCLDCGAKIHKYCAAIRFHGVPAEKRKCPKCGEVWDQELISLPEADSTPDEAPAKKSKSVSGRKSAGRR